MKLTISTLSTVEPAAARALKPEYKNCSMDFGYTQGVLWASPRIDKVKELGAWMLFWNQVSSEWEE